MAANTNMADFREIDKLHFPLSDSKGVIEFFSDQLEKEHEPDLALLSIVAGCVESLFTVKITSSDLNDNVSETVGFPVIELSLVQQIYEKFVSRIRDTVNISEGEIKVTTHEIVKKVSDSVWNYLSRSYHKEKSHLQSIYSFIKDHKLDSFGVAVATVAGCQILGLKNVHLAFSEDHVWLVWGDALESAMEVTWHGKGVEDKRGQPVDQLMAQTSWLYAGGRPIICSRQMEVAAVIMAISPLISSGVICSELVSIQKDLLWLLYDLGHLNRHPLALTFLAGLELKSSTNNRPSPLFLYRRAIVACKDHYDDVLVYPHIKLGNFYFQRQQYREALQCWADAAQIVKRYRYGRDDEELYKRLKEIATEKLPHIVKQNVIEVADGSLKDPGVLQDAECYALLLKFMDGLCMWEEGSSTPVLHEGWVGQLLFVMNRFEPCARTKVSVIKLDDGMHDGNDSSDGEREGRKTKRKMLRRDSDSTEKKENVTPKRKKLQQDGLDESKPLSVKSKDNYDELTVADKTNLTDTSVVVSSKFDSVVVEKTDRSAIKQDIKELNVEKRESCNDNYLHELTSCNNGDLKEEEIKRFIEELVVDQEEYSPLLLTLAQACTKYQLNPNYLLNIGSGEPFCNVSMQNETVGEELNEFLSSRAPFPGLTVDSVLEACLEVDVPHLEDDFPPTPVLSPILPPNVNSAALTPLAQNVTLELHSRKMNALSRFFCSEKLNAGAIRLQLTAQSQVQVKSSGSATRRHPRDTHF